ncbi:hypothetical protein LCGC14_0515740 [marine sediment metagenome]|uniref:Histidine kinase N-terminal 7TM region domain-containing protein n=1 Tax=marine sediment metagenome TaxID=412755 RepID=A0A0F9S4S6_9ZZZZ
MFYFSLIAFKVLKRNKQRLNIIFSAFFISTIMAAILNMIYAALTDTTIILILNYFTNFFTCFGAIFLLVVNIVILESTIIFPVKKQNRYIVLYGLLLLIGMLPFYLLKRGWGVWIENNYPRFSPIFLIFVISFASSFVGIPIISTSLKIYTRFETKALKKKWRYHFIGTLGVFSIPYLIWINNYVFSPDFRLIVGIYGISAIFWGYLMYYGIGFKLKE